MAFHAVPDAGATFAPMRLPVFVAGISCSPAAYGGAEGAVSGKLLKAERETLNFKRLFGVFYIRDGEYGYCLGLRKRGVKKPTKSEKVG